jgi:bifunctional DNA-binding transcriptional regulator/antitoxin component of YhaV-PrlF toxin-antitoxin module
MVAPCGTSGTMCHMDTYVTDFHINSKGRNSIPANIRRDAGIVEDVETLIYVERPGRIVIETREAVCERVWEGAPVPGGLDMTQDVREMRNEDVRIADEAYDRRSVQLTPGDPVGMDSVGEALLAELGL